MHELNLDDVPERPPERTEKILDLIRRGAIHRPLIGDVAVTGSEDGFQAIAHGGEAWVNVSDTFGIHITSTEPSLWPSPPSFEEDALLIPRDFTLDNIIPGDLVGRKVKNWRVTLELEFEDESPPESSQAT